MDAGSGSYFMFSLPWTDAQLLGEQTIYQDAEKLRYTEDQSEIDRLMSEINTLILYLKPEANRSGAGSEFNKAFKKFVNEKQSLPKNHKEREHFINTIEGIVEQALIQKVNEEELGWKPNPTVVRDAVKSKVTIWRNQAQEEAQRKPKEQRAAEGEGAGARPPERERKERAAGGVAAGGGVKLQERESKERAVGGVGAGGGAKPSQPTKDLSPTPLHFGEGLDPKVYHAVSGFQAVEILKENGEVGDYIIHQSSASRENAPVWTYTIFTGKYMKDGREMPGGNVGGRIHLLPDGRYSVRYAQNEPKICNTIEECMQEAQKWHPDWDLHPYLPPS